MLLKGFFPIESSVSLSRESTSVIAEKLKCCAAAKHVSAHDTRSQLYIGYSWRWQELSVSGIKPNGEKSIKDLQGIICVNFLLVKTKHTKSCIK